ncbi:flagellar basal body-associated FliL family protein [Paenibacillus sp. P96]|uniref:Flagellar protein FliL n=1 Tax=Paenibacillus zeirhizosphaerae TaxID=2987519 RepID=A0ABT9FSE2_9BACL|nr:flagellar basal body-associated FliL family protein [Paenibacillus sp. P96]MDP4097535.1 flagellar basal body-associated FliL family protein [Paenibacillus sp. P96]
MKKMLPWLLTTLLGITLIVLAAFLLLPQLTGGESSKAAAKEHSAPKLSADEIVEVTSEMKEIRTNLADSDYVVAVNIAFQLNNGKAKESFEKIKDISIKPIVIQTFADTKPEQLKTAKGREEFADRLTALINKTLPEGKLVSTKFTEFMLATL